MTQLIVACFLFFAIHLFVSGTPLRDRLVAAMGENPYRGLFSLASLGFLVWAGFAYAAVKNTNVLWVAPQWMPHAGALVMLIAFLFAVVGLATPNPTMVQQEGLLKKGDEAVRGIVTVTRHPFMWGVILWAAFHIAANGDGASLVFFGTFIVVALAGMVSLDAKRRRAAPDDWNAFAARTSLVPFAAIMTKRTSLDLKGFGLARPSLAIAIFAIFFWAHPWLFGASPA